MESQTIINGAFGVICTLLGVLFTVLYNVVRDLQKSDLELTDRVQHIEVLVAGEYVKKEYLDARIDKMEAAIFAQLTRIEDKLDGKVDKA